MKKVFLSIAVIMLAIVSAEAQSMSSFFREEGVRCLAAAAHPTNVYSRGEYVMVSENIVRVKIWYEEGYTTELRVRRDRDFFTRITVISDTDWAPPFLAIELIKYLLYEIIYDEDEDEVDEEMESVLHRFEELVEETVDEMTGENLACLILTLCWLAY
jgi:hypothetical protein